MAEPGSGWLQRTNVVAKWKALSKTLPDIPAAEFAGAAHTLISVFDLINGMAMAKGDMVKNANTVQSAAETAAPIETPWKRMCSVRTPSVSTRWE